MVPDVSLIERGIELPSPCRRGVGGEVTIGSKRTVSLNNRRQKIQGIGYGIRLN